MIKVKCGEYYLYIDDEVVAYEKDSLIVRGDCDKLDKIERMSDFHPELMSIDLFNIELKRIRMLEKFGNWSQLSEYEKFVILYSSIIGDGHEKLPELYDSMKLFFI